MSVSVSGTNGSVAVSRAFTFVALLGIVSLFADVTYEGARSVLGPYLRELSAGIVLTGALAGIAEAAAYALRVVTGHVADRTRAYWTFTFLGYIVNLGAVPLLAVAGEWQLAAILVLAERAGKALRVPARDTLLAEASRRLGYGTAFGIHEMMDQIGAIGGPIWVAVSLWFADDMRAGFLALGIPALLALLALTAARIWWARNVQQPACPPTAPQHPEEPPSNVAGRRRAFIIFCSFAFLTNVAFANWLFLGYLFQAAIGLHATWIAIAYAIAMGVDAIAAIPLGAMFDRVGLRALLPAAPIGAAATVVGLLGPNKWFAIACAALWGLAMAFQETVFKAVVPHLVGQGRRATAYGWVQASQGLGWLVGSGLLGVLYQHAGAWAGAGAAGLLGVIAAWLALRLARLDLSASAPGE